MANVKYTSRNFYTDVMNGNITEQVKEYARESIKKMDEKNANRAKSQTPSQKANEVIKTEIAAFLEEHADEGFTVSDLLKAVPVLEGDSNQHASALLRQLVQAGVVAKYSEKRRTYFKIAG